MEVGVARCSISSESIVSRAVTLFPSDTVLAGLQLMHRHGLAVLPVVDEERGELMGEVTEGEVCRVGSRLPLMRLAEVLTVKAHAGGEGMTTGEELDGITVGSAAPWLH